MNRPEQTPKSSANKSATDRQHDAASSKEDASFSDTTLESSPAQSARPESFEMNQHHTDSDPVAELLKADHDHVDAPPELLDRILEDIPDPLPATVHLESERSGARDEGSSPAQKDNVIRGRFVRSPQLLALAAGLLLLLGAGWIALRLGDTRSPLEWSTQTAPDGVPTTDSVSAARSAAESARNSPNETPSAAEVTATAVESTQGALQELRDAELEPTDSRRPTLEESVAEGPMAEEEDRLLERQEMARQPNGRDANTRDVGEPEPVPSTESGEAKRSSERRSAVTGSPSGQANEATKLSVTSAAPSIAPERPAAVPGSARAAVPAPSTLRTEARAEPPPPPPSPAPPTSRRLQRVPISSSSPSTVAEEQITLHTQVASTSEDFDEIRGREREDDLALDRRVADEERFAPRLPKPLTDPAEDPQSTFGLDVDTASYTMVRAALRAGRLPDPARVRPEELLNAFDYQDPPPRDGNDFALYSEVGAARYASMPERRLIRFALKAREVSSTQRLPAHLTFVVDTSGSMRQDGRLETVKQALELLLGALRPDDRVALVRYSERAELLVDPTTDQLAVRRALDALRPSGSTNLQAGLEVGYQAADRGFRDGAVNRVILLSDGIANVGETEALPILRSVADWAARGVELTTVGVGMTHNDPLLEQLANRGDGNYAYVDTLEEARRLFQEQLTGTLETVASDARVQVTFDPSVVAGYRLIGYDNRALPDHVFRNDRVDAGEVGAGHQVTALYEVELRSPQRPTTRTNRQPAITFELRYRSRQSGEFEERQQVVQERQLRAAKAAPATGGLEPSPAFRLAAIVAALAEELQEGHPRPSVFDELARQTRGLVSHFEDDPRVLELAYLLSEAAAISGSSR